GVVVFGGPLRHHQPPSRSDDRTYVLSEARERWHRQRRLRGSSRAPYDLRMKRAGVLAAPLLTLALISCGGGSAGTSGSASTPAGIDIRGRITELTTPASDASPASPGGMLVEGEVEPDTHYSKAWVRMQGTTVVWRRSSARTLAAAIGDLRLDVR